MKDDLQNLMLLDGLSESVKKIYDENIKHQRQIKNLKRAIIFIMIINVSLLILVMTIIWRLI